jgi:hypothetical protein
MKGLLACALRLGGCRLDPVHPERRARPESKDQRERFLGFGGVC